jgi:hypothetical protein
LKTVNFALLHLQATYFKKTLKEEMMFKKSVKLVEKQITAKLATALCGSLVHDGWTFSMVPTSLVSLPHIVDPSR